MTWGFFDRIEDTTTTTGTGNVTVSGTAPTGRRTFSAVYAVGDRVPYVIDTSSGAEWEVGRGTYASANVIERTEVLASSNAGAAVNFSAGTKRVYVDAIAFFLNDVDTHGQVLARTIYQAMI